jgi:hypothetical protein
LTAAASARRRFIDHATRCARGFAPSHTTGARAQECAGGLWSTSQETDEKNAITNELYFVNAMRLWNRRAARSCSPANRCQPSCARPFHSDGDPQYLQWAQREWAWFAN